MNIKKYEGIIPALYACYDDNGAISIERTKALTQWFIDQGVNGGIGGTYGAMPKLYIKLYELAKSGDLKTALDIQNDCCRIIYKLCSGHGNMYAMIKECLRRMGCPDCGSVRAPLAELIDSDYAIADECVAMIQESLGKYC